jgi:hypothetical protein
MSTPAEVMTWSKLKDDVLAYCERQDQETIAQIPRFIMLAEHRIASEVRGLGLLRVLHGTMEAGSPVIKKPENWRESSSFSVIVGTRHKNVYKRSYEFCRTYAPDASIKRTPRYYADYDFHTFLVVPSPDINYDFELVFFEKPTPLSAENETNWVTNHAPQLLLYATLLEAQPFLKSDTRVETFKSFYIQAAQAVLEESRRREVDRSSGQGG